MESHPLNDVESNDSTTMVKHSPSSDTPSAEVRLRKRHHDDDDDDDDDEKDKVKDLLVYYAQNSTMHGIPSIVGSKLYRGRHVFWMFIVIMMALFLGTVIYWQMKDYYDYPTVTSVDIHYVQDEDFPAITVCDPNIFHGDLLKYARVSNYTAFQIARLTEIAGLYHTYAKRFLDKEKNPPERGDTDTIAEMQLLLKVNTLLVSSPQDSPLYCSWGKYYWEKCPAASTRITEMGICSTVDVRKLTNMTHLANVSSEDRTSQTIGNFMRGFTFYLDTVPKIGPYRIFRNQGFKIVLHDINQEPLPLSSGINIEGNAAVEVSVSKHVKEGLPAPYKAFGTATCIETDSDSFKNPLHRFENYTKEVCEHECFIDFVVKQCGECRHFLHPGNETFCPLDHLALCYRDAQRLYYGGEVENHKCNCPLPCRQINFKAAVTSNVFVETDYMKELKNRAGNTAQHVVSYVHIYYSDPVVTTMRQVAIYSTEGLLGSIGGQIGLFMGFSLVTVAEMLELLFLLATRGRKLDEHVKRHKDAHEAAVAAVRPA